MSYIFRKIVIDPNKVGNVFTLAIIMTPQNEKSEIFASYLIQM